MSSAYHSIPEQERPRILVADDHRLVRSGLVAVLEEADCFRIVGEAGDGLETLEAALRLRPDVALVDLKMPRMDGLEVTREMKRCCPEVAVLVVTSLFDEFAIRESLQAGAAGYLLKDCTPEELVTAIFRVLRGQIELSPRVARSLALAQTPLAFDTLTPREREVLIQIAAGGNNEDVARELSISVKTVKVHVGNLFSKLNCDSRLKLAVYAWRNRLVSAAGDEALTSLTGGRSSLEKWSRSTR